MTRSSTTVFSFVLIAVLTAVSILVTGLPDPAWGYSHKTSKIKFHDYNQTTFDLAKKQNKPIFLLLSASWCYWCKTYKQKTLETGEASQLLNRNFINVFVDIDQRQDLQTLYVKRAIPTSIIFTPDGKEFISFSGILDQGKFIDGIRQVLGSMRQNQTLPAGDAQPTLRNIRPLLVKTDEIPVSGLAELSDKAGQMFVAFAHENFDFTHAGFGADKRFPLPRTVSYLLEQYTRKKDEASLKIAVAILAKITDHLFDSVEGGFFRYTDRPDWRIPRHEKLLVANINMIRLFQIADKTIPQSARLPGKASYGLVFRQSLDFFLKTYASPAQGFYGSLDGRTPEYYRLSASKRTSAKKPKLDRTIFTAWNGEAIFVLSSILRESPDPRVRKSIVSALEFLQTKLLSLSGGFYTYFETGQGRLNGQGRLVDNSWGALALITGHELTGKKEYLSGFEKVFQFAKTRLYLPEQGAYRMWNVPARQGFRTGEEVSTEIPLATNSVMALALIQAFRSTGKKEYRDIAEKMMVAFSEIEPDLFSENPNDTPKVFMNDYILFLNALDQLKKLKS